MSNNISSPFVHVERNGELSTGKMVATSEEVKKVTSGNEKEYLIIIKLGSIDEIDEDLAYTKFVEGREAAYNFIADHFLQYCSIDDTNYIDWDNSFVIVEGINITERVTIEKFMTYTKEKYMKDSDFDIKSYIYDIEDNKEKEEFKADASGPIIGEGLDFIK